MSVAVAPPRLIRKLQCMVLTWAPPICKPRQPAASMSFQALWPGGFLKVEPPVRLLIGWVASRLSVILSISAAITAGSPGRALEYRLGEDDVVGRAAMAVGVVHVRIGEAQDAAGAVDAARHHQHVLGLAAIGAAIHAQRAADRTGYAAQKRQAGDRGLLGGARHLHVGHRGAGAHAVIRFDRDLAEAAAEPDHHAGDAAVAHDEIGAEADDGDRQFGGKLRQQHGEVLGVLRREQHLRRPADPEPGQLRQRLVGDETPAQPGHPRAQVGNEVGKGHADGLECVMDGAVSRDGSCGILKRMMIKILRDAVQQAETWPQEDQEELAEYAREVEARRTGVYIMSDEERAAVRRGLAQADRGEFVPDELVAEADKRHDQ